MLSFTLLVRHSDHSSEMLSSLNLYIYYINKIQGVNELFLKELIGAFLCWASFVPVSSLRERLS